MVGLRPRSALEPLEDGVHVLGPDGLREVLRGALDALVDDRLAVVHAAAPHDGGALRGEAAEPQVGALVGRAGLARDGLVGVEVARDDPGGAQRGDVALEYLDHVGGDGGVQGLLGVILVLVDHVAVAVLDAGDGHGVAVHAARGDRGVGLAHLERGHHGGAERRGEAGLDRGVDAEGRRHLDDRLHADGVGDLHVAGVGGDHRRAGERAHAVVVVAVVARRVARRDAQRGGVGDHDRGAHAGVERRREDDALEARAGLALRGREVDRALAGLGVVAVVLAADHRDDVAVGVVDRDERAAELGVVGAGDALGDRLLGDDLLVGLEGRVDVEAALQDGVGREVLQQQLAHVVGEVGVVADGVGELAGVDDDLLGAGGIVLLLRDDLGLEHAVEHEVAALLARLEAVGVKRVVDRRRVGDAHEQGRLGEGELARVLVEVGDARGLDAVGAVAVVDGVEVHVEDLVLRVLLLHLDGDVGLADLAAQRVLELLVREHGVADELLGDGGAAARVTAARDLAHHGAHDALGVDAVVVVEALVLGCDDALLHVVGDLVERHRAAVLQIVGRDLGAVGVVDARGLRDEVGVGGGVVGEVLEPGAHEGAQRERERDAEKSDETEHARDAKSDEVGLGVRACPAGSDPHRGSSCSWGVRPQTDSL